MEIEELKPLIRISRERPLLPETYVPWSGELQSAKYSLPEHLNSLEGLELGRHEMVPVMYSYTWGEGLL